MAFSLAVLPNSAHDSVWAQRFRRGWQYGGYDCALTTAKSKYWVSTYNSGEDIATTPALSEVDGRPNLGLLASPLLTFKFITHSWPVQSDLLAMYSQRRKSSVDANVFQESYSEREWASRNPRFSSMASRSGRPRRTGSSNENLWSGISYEIASWRTEEASVVWSTIRDEYARIKGRERRQGSPWINAADSFSTHGTNQANQSSDHSRREANWLYTELEDRERALQWTRIRTLQEMERIQKKFLLYRSWQSSTVEPRRTSWTRNESQSTVNRFTVRIEKLKRQSEFSERFQGFLWPWDGKQLWVIPRSQSPGDCSESLWNARGLTHGVYVVHRETFLKIYLHQTSRQQLVLEM